jgi:predicted acyltransferase
MPNDPSLPVSTKASPAPPRLVSLDAYRGFIMLAMASSGFMIGRVLKDHPDLGENPVWRFLGYQLDHVAWTGCSFWDLIQPSFMFMVGVAIPYSYASRKAKGDSEATIFRHTLARALILIVLGVFLSSNWSKHTDVTFVNVLSQIGLGYAFVYLLRGRGLLLQSFALVAILVGYWFLFYTYPVPKPDFNFQALNASPEERFEGLYAHWDKNANVAADVDVTLLNLFRRREPITFEFTGRTWVSEVFLREERFEFNKGGYATLNFIPSMATMLFGLMAGELLRSGRMPTSKRNLLILAGLLCLAVGFLTDYTIWPDRFYVPPVDEGSTAVSLFHVCPIVKRIWTPTWAVFSTGWTFLMLAGFYWLIDVHGYQRWAFPLTVVGMNSIAMYCMAQLMKPWLRETLKRHFGQNIFTGTYGLIVESVAILGSLWLICFWLYRRKIFVRI